MKIGVDIRPLQNNNRFRGIGRYLENTLRYMAPLAADNTFVFYTEAGSSLPQDIIKLFQKIEIKTVPKNNIQHVKYVRAMARPYTKIKVNSADVDVFFQGDPWLGIPHNVATVATFHDLIPLLFKPEKESSKQSGLKRYKQRFREIVQDKYYQEMLASYSSAKVIVAISEASKKDFVKHIDASAENRIFVTPLAGSEASFPIATPALRTKVRKKYELGSDPFLLYVGGIDLRKNIVGLASDFIKLKKTHKNLKLVMVGKEFGLKRDLNTLGWTSLLQKHPDIAKDIITPGFVSDDDMAILYQEAAVFTFPSLYEGFGLPILEAMHLSCPVVCYDNSSLPEVAADAALVVPNGTSMVNAIDKVLSNNSIRNELINKGNAQVQNFTWENTAKLTLEAIEAAAA